MRGVTTLILLGTFMFNLGLPAAGTAQTSRSTVAGDFVSKLPVGTNTRLRLDDGRKIKGTLMNVENDAVVIRVNTRIPEPPLRIELSRIADAEIERGGANMGKAIAAGTAAGAGAALGVFFLLVAIYSD